MSIRDIFLLYPLEHTREDFTMIYFLRKSIRAPSVQQRNRHIDQIRSDQNEI